MSKLLDYLASATGLLTSDVRGIIGRAPVSYKRYYIKKKSGGKRLIAQPAREVKVLQRLVVDLFSHLPVHPAATAYKKGSSIRHNAEPHAKNGPIRKYDFTEFFTSIRERDWQTYCKNGELFADHEDVELSSRLLFFRVPGTTVLRLAIGAPSSPWLSNVLMYEFDRRLTEALLQDQVTYTRYADDLTFSAKRTGYLVNVDQILRKTLAEIDFPRLTINESKTVTATMKYQRFVTGLVLANDGRVTIGRNRKREIRLKLFQAFAGHLANEEMVTLAGTIAFVKAVEPAYFEKLIAEYGENLLSRLATANGSPASTAT